MDEERPSFEEAVRAAMARRGHANGLVVFAHPEDEDAVRVPALLMGIPVKVSTWAIRGAPVLADVYLMSTYAGSPPIKPPSDIMIAIINSGL